MSVHMRDRYGYDDEDDRHYDQRIKHEAFRIARHQAGLILKRCVLTACALLAILCSGTAAFMAWQGSPFFTGGAWLACSLGIVALLRPALSAATGG